MSVCPLSCAMQLTTLAPGQQGPAQPGQHSPLLRASPACQQALTAPPSAPLTIGAVALRIAITYVQSYFDKFAPLTKQNNAGLPYQGRRHSRRGLAPVSGMNNTVTAQQRPGRPALEGEGGAAQGEPSLASLPPSQPLRRLVLGRDNGMWDWDCFTLSVNRRCMAVADPSTWRAIIVLILSGTTPGRQERVFLPSLSDSRPLVLLGLGPISTAGMAAPAPHTRAFSYVRVTAGSAQAQARPFDWGRR